MPLPQFPWEPVPREVVTRFPQMGDWEKSQLSRQIVWLKQTQSILNGLTDRIRALETDVSTLKKA